jgi:hypothetical protein
MKGRVSLVLGMSAIILIGIADCKESLLCEDVTDKEGVQSQFCANTSIGGKTTQYILNNDYFEKGAM